jgi:hypothetical protein
MDIAAAEVKLHEVPGRRVRYARYGGHHRVNLVVEWEAPHAAGGQQRTGKYDEHRQQVGPIRPPPGGTQCAGERSPFPLAPRQNRVSPRGAAAGC